MFKITILPIVPTYKSISKRSFHACLIVSSVIRMEERFRWCYPLSSLFLRFVYVALVGLSIGMGRVYSSFYADFLSLSLQFCDGRFVTYSLLLFPSVEVCVPVGRYH